MKQLPCDVAFHMIIDKWGKMIILCLDKTINLALCWFRLKGKPKLS